MALPVSGMERASDINFWMTPVVDSSPSARLVESARKLNGLDPNPMPEFTMDIMNAAFKAIGNGIGAEPDLLILPPHLAEMVRSLGLEEVKP